MGKDNLKVLVTEKADFIADAKELLEAALAENFEGVLIVGIKNGDIYRTSSKQKSVVEVVGMLELAKAELIKTW